MIVINLFLHSNNSSIFQLCFDPFSDPAEAETKDEDDDDHGGEDSEEYVAVGRLHHGAVQLQRLGHWVSLANTTNYTK